MPARSKACSNREGLMGYELHFAGAVLAVLRSAEARLLLLCPNEN